MEKRKVFWKIYITLVVIGVVGIIFVWIVLWDFLAVYEKSQPDYVAEDVVSEFNSDDIDGLMKYITYDCNELEPDEVLIKYIKERLADGGWNYSKKINEYSKDAPVYQLESQSGYKAVLYISKTDETGKYNTPQWSINRIDGVIGDAADYTFVVPKGSKISINDVELDDLYITADGLEPDNLGNVTKYITAPVMTEYTVKGLLAKPEIKVKGPVYGSELAVDSSDGNKTVYAFESADELVNEVNDRVVEITKIYGNYSTNDVKFSALSPYILPNSHAYTYLKNIESINVWTASHAPDEFNNMEVYNYQIYTDTCFSCEVSFDLVVTTSYKSVTYPTHIMYVFIKNGNTWYMADISFKDEK